MVLQAFDMEDQRCRDTLLHTGDMVCFDRGDGTVVSVSQAGASWQLEQYPIHGAQSCQTGTLIQDRLLQRHWLQLC